ncbi:class I SAM-dependent methyltransferase [Nocardioides mesophilus]|uniref:Class I SAM-dependent methyltransferase n=1 Tax=Nocardioides mesophilus TaxID=433659 RepID=A0A7G9R7E0_9ACTN|nr:class I SAM-dependent methyltransferase [Nocardioides mesophilus]QNN51515.1 class I SAM-dependent methyltransferase [Nocardioides mesophilus]
MGIEETRAAWDAEAVTFDEEPDHGLRDTSVREVWRELLSRHLPAAPARVADLGCGTGTLSVLLAEQGYVVDGIDLSPEMVARARAKAAEHPDELLVSFAEGDASAPRLEAGCYDVVLCRHVLWALPDPVSALRRWAGLLVPGGAMLLVEGHWFNGAGLSAAECRRLLAAAGRDCEVVPLAEPAYWGREISDERYLALSQA